MNFHKLIFLGSLLFTTASFAFNCPHGQQEPELNQDVRKLIQTKRAYFFFTENVDIGPGKSRAKVAQVSIVSLNGINRNGLTIKSHTPRKILSYDYGHTQDYNWYAYTPHLRIYFEGSRYHPKYGTFLVKSKRKIVICLANQELDEI